MRNGRKFRMKETILQYPEFYMNLESALESFHGKERKIAERILFYGESDTEAAIQEAVSRQYCNRIRKKFVRKM